MRAVLRPYVQHMKWPMRAAAFIVHLMHQLAAFFAWIWMFVHMIGTFAQAGLHATKIWETRVLDDIWAHGLQFLSSAGRGWQGVLAVAVIPAFLVAVRNAYATYEQFHAWVHDHTNLKDA